MDLNNAIGMHIEWKTTLRNAIKQQSSLDAAVISKDNQCDLGKWLHGEARSKHGQLASYTNCVAKHAAFHVEAGKVAEAINSKNFDAAEKMLDIGTPYTAASKEVGVAILHLNKETTI